MLSFVTASRVVAIVMLICLALPPSASAANVFGGKIGMFLPCPFNLSLWATVGAPRGGIYIWTPFTKTYPKGSIGPGESVIGLYGIPYFCLFMIAPLIPIPGISMTMVGSS